MKNSINTKKDNAFKWAQPKVIRDKTRIISVHTSKVDLGT